MTFEDYKNCHYFRWMVMSGHYLGITQFISRFLRTTYDISYKEFYQKLLQYAYDNPDTIIGRELKETIFNLENTLAAKQPWGRILNDVRKNFAWDFEEATAINVCKNKNVFYLEIKEFLKTCFDFDYDEDLMKDLFKYQLHGILDPRVKYPIKKSFNYNIHNVVTKKEKLKKLNNEIEFTAKNYNGNFYEWGKEILWWGRRVGSCKTKRREM